MKRKKLNIQIDPLLAHRWNNLKSRFHYNTNVKLIEDLLYFFETNPVNPKEKFGGIMKDILNKMDEFNKDNNRVINVVRKIENDKINPVYRAVLQDLPNEIKALKKEKDTNYISNIVVPGVQKEDKNDIKTDNDSVIKSLEEKNKRHIERFALLEKEYDKATLEYGTLYNKLKKLNNLYTVEKSTFSSKNKIVIEMNESDFLKLISLK